MKNFKLGFTACYIRDYKFTHLVDLPDSSAVEWVKEQCPNTAMGNGILAKDLTIGTGLDTDVDRVGWLNKLFILVGNDHGRWVALNNHDGLYSVHVENIN